MERRREGDRGQNCHSTVPPFETSEVCPYNAALLCQSCFTSLSYTTLHPSLSLSLSLSVNYRSSMCVRMKSSTSVVCSMCSGRVMFLYSFFYTTAHRSVAVMLCSFFILQYYEILLVYSCFQMKPFKEKTFLFVFLFVSRCSVLA